MSGGIFPSRPFAWNIKCIIFTAIIAGGYWFLPPKHKWILVFLLWLPYVALAWYDYKYDCNDKMQPTIVPYGRHIFLPFKPDGYKRAFDKLDKGQIQAMDRLDHITTWTLAIVAIGFVIYKLQKNKNLNTY
jgi:hypothetical protein